MAIKIGRRQFISAIGGTAVAWPLAARAQQPAMPMIGYLSSKGEAAEAGIISAIRKGLEERGFIDGKNVAIAYRWSDGAPMGQFARARTYPNASFRDVTAPNADTLYTSAWIDVGDEPWVLSIPDMKDRYFLVPMLDAWTNVFQVPGKRTTGTGAQTYAITGPRWKGTLPSGVKEYQSPTNLV